MWLTTLLVVGTVISGRKSAWLTSSSILLINYFVVGGVATSIAIGFVPNWLEFQKFKVPVIVWLVTSAIVDSTITAVLTWNLVCAHSTFFISDHS
jgi:hypothetical protein